MDASSLYQHSLKTIKGEHRALLIGQYGSTFYPVEDIQKESLEELYQLCDTAGISFMQDIFVKVQHPSASTFIHAGTIEQVKKMRDQDKINLLVIDASLKPNQLRNLEDELKMRVLGRIELILDIFSMRAKSKVSALQVELAQLTYILPRLKGLGGVLSRLGGGIGTRGPGETMLETDRRHIRRRIQKIKDDLVRVKTHKDNTRKNRHLPSFALVGYTNAGKSTLLNQLSSSHKKSQAEDRLFATLDSYTRKIFLGTHNYYPLYGTLTDTVGFIRNLPASLVAAFQSTLDEILYADVIVMVVDASSNQMEDEIHIVDSELEKMGAADKPRILFFNKEDLVFPATRAKLTKEYPDAIWGSAVKKDGVEDLRETLMEYMQNFYIPAREAVAQSHKNQLY